MKNKRYQFKRFTVLSGMTFSIAMALCASPSIVSAESANGVLVLNLDANALASLNGGKNESGKRYMYVEDFFDQSYNNIAIQGDEPNPTPGIDPIPSLGLRLPVSGASITPAPEEAGRYLQATTFDYTGDPTQGSGVIGLNGAIRFHSDSWPGTLLMRDMTLNYDATRINKDNAGESGWVIKTNEPYFGTQAVFDVTDVTTTTLNGALKLSGNVFMTETWAALLAIPNGIKVGSVSLVPADNAVFDANAAVVALQDVQLQDQHYDVQLQMQTGNLFKIKTSQTLPAQQHIQPATYDAMSQDLTVPKVLVFGKYYSAKLHNVGNYQFRLDQFTEVR